MDNFEDRYTSSIFEEVLEEINGKEENDEILNDSEKIDVLESVEMNLNDEDINRSKCSMIAYGLHVDENDEVEAYNPKNNPDKAIDILFEYPETNDKIEIFLDTQTKEWNSIVNEKGKLTPEQMEQFFKSEFYSKMKNKLEKDWPCSEDDLFCDLMNGVNQKKYGIDCQCRNEESDGKIDEDEGIERHKHNVKLGKPNEKDANGNKIRSSSGRKLINFSDMGVSTSNYEAYYSWPGAYLKNTQDIDSNDKDALKKIFKWSRWCDWEKQKPFIRARFSYNVSGGSSSPDIIGLSLTLHPEDNPNRGLISYDISLIPSLQYLTPEETQQILKLSIIRKFMKECLNRIESILAIRDEEIFRRVNKPEKCTLDDIRKTKRVIKNTLKAVRDLRADTFIYS